MILTRQVTDHSAVGRSPDTVRVWTSPEAERPVRMGDYNPSLRFANDNLAVYGDGRGVLFVLKTGNRTDEFPAEWSTLFHDEVRILLFGLSRNSFLASWIPGCVCA